MFETSIEVNTISDIVSEASHTDFQQMYHFASFFQMTPKYRIINGVKGYFDATAKPFLVLE